MDERDEAQGRGVERVTVGSPRVRVDAVDWARVLPAMHLLRAVPMALRPTKVLIAWAMVAVVVLWGAALDGVFGDVADLNGPTSMLWKLDGVDREDAGTFEASIQSVVYGFHLLQESSARLMFDGVRDGLVLVFVILPVWLITEHLWFTVAFGLVAAAVKLPALTWLQRRAAREALGVERAGRADGGLRGLGVRCVTVALAYALFGVVLLAFAMVLWVGGLLLGLPVLDVVGGVLAPVWVLAAFGFAVVFAIAWVSMHLIEPAVVVDRADVFDAVSRAVNYTLGRPLKWLGYQAVNLVVLVVVVGAAQALVAGAVGVLRGLAGMTTIGTQGAVDLATLLPAGATSLWTPVQDDVTGSAVPAAWLVLLAVKGLLLLPVAVGVSLYVCQQTWVYLLLRRAADGTELFEHRLDEAEA